MKRPPEDPDVFAQEPTFAPETLLYPQAPPHAAPRAPAGKRRVIAAGGLGSWVLCSMALAALGGMWMGCVLPAQARAHSAEDALAQALRANAQLEAQLLAPARVPEASAKSSPVADGLSDYDGEAVGQATQIALEDLSDRAAVAVHQDEQTVVVQVASGPAQLKHLAVVLQQLAHQVTGHKAHVRVVMAQPSADKRRPHSDRWSRLEAITDVCAAAFAPLNDASLTWDVMVVPEQKDRGTLVVRLGPA